MPEQPGNIESSAEAQAAALVLFMYEARRRKDFAAVNRCCHPDFVFSSNAHPGRYGEVVQQVGAEHVEPYLALVDSLWEPVDKMPGPPRPPVLEPGEPRERGFVFHVNVRTKMRHRASGLVFEGSKRHEWVVQDGKISAMSQFLDTPLINAIIKLDEEEKKNKKP